MKKIVISSIIGAFLLAAISFGQYDPNSDFGTLVVKLNRGWNLIPLTGIHTGSAGEFNTCGDILGRNSETTKAAFIWSPVEKRYLGGAAKDVAETDSEASRVLNRDKQAGFYYAQEFGGAVFIYRDGPECSYTTELGKVSNVRRQEKEFNEFLQKVKVVKGWNFIMLHPWMQDLSFNEFIGTCDMTHAFLFDPVNQRWSGGSVSKSDLSGAAVTAEHIGKIFAFKFSSDCNFSIKLPELVPPPLPE